MTRIVVLLLAMLLMAAVVFAQGVQTGSLRGVVRDAQHLPLPGATLTAVSPSLQGVRGAVADAEGAFTLAALPAGRYTVTVEMPGFASVQRTVDVPLGLPVQEDVTLALAGVDERVRVVAAPPSPLATPSVGANFTQREIDSLATGRTVTMCLGGGLGRCRRRLRFRSRLITITSSASSPTSSIHSRRWMRRDSSTRSSAVTTSSPA